MKPVVERIVNFPSDEPAADPKPTDTVPHRPRIDAARDLMSFESLLPWLAGVGHDQFLPHDKPLNIDLLFEFAVVLLQHRDSLLQCLDLALESVEVLIGGV